MDHCPAKERYTATGPLLGGRCMVKLGISVRVSTSLRDCDEVVNDLTNKLMKMGY